jgi:hypothetical protein
MAILFVFGICLVLFALVWLWSVRQALMKRRRAFIREYRFPPEIFDNLRDKHPQLDDGAKLRMVEKALRAYFVLYLRSGFKTVGMPSKVTDDLWHEFILDTRAYAAFCKQAFGRFFHHIPAGVMGRSEKQDKSLVRTWRLGCMSEGLDPFRSAKLPILFGIDAALAVQHGQVHDARELVARAKQDAKDAGGGGCGGGGSCGGCGCGGGGCGGGCGGG